MEYYLTDGSKIVKIIESYLSSKEKMAYAINTIKNGDSSLMNAILGICYNSVTYGYYYGLFLTVDKNNILLIQTNEKQCFEYHIYSIKLSSFQSKNYDSLKEIMNIDFNSSISMVELENNLRAIHDNLIKPYEA